MGVLREGFECIVFRWIDRFRGFYGFFNVWFFKVIFLLERFRVGFCFLEIYYFYFLGFYKVLNFSVFALIIVFGVILRRVWEFVFCTGSEGSFFMEDLE